jgi:hypothetical protein
MDCTDLAEAERGMNMRKSCAVAALLVVLALSFVTLGHGSAQSGDVSPLTGETGYTTPPEDGYRHDFTSDRPRTLPALVGGGLYGTDGLNLYLINKTTGSAALIGPHGPVENAIGALAFASNGTLYGISLGTTARLYRIDPTTGAATAIGPLGIGFVFEGGLDFDASGQLFGVNVGTGAEAQAFTVNTATGAATVVGPIPGETRDLNGLAFDGLTFYAIDRTSNSLGTLNPASGAYTSIGNVGATIGATGGLAIDPSDGALYATFESTGGFYELNKSTGAATFIASNGSDYGLAFAPLVAFTEFAYLPLVLK